MEASACIPLWTVTHAFTTLVFWLYIVYVAGQVNRAFSQINDVFASKRIRLGTYMFDHTSWRGEKGGKGEEEWRKSLSVALQYEAAFALDKDVVCLFGVRLRGEVVASLFGKCVLGVFLVCQTLVALRSTLTLDYLCEIEKRQVYNVSTT